MANRLHYANEQDADESVHAEIEPSALKRAWTAVSNAVRGDNFLGLFLRSNLIGALLTLALLLLFFAFPPVSTGIMLQLGTTLGAFAFWTYASTYAGAVSIVVAQTYTMILVGVMTLFGMVDGVEKLIGFCKRTPDSEPAESKGVQAEIPTNSASNAPPRHTRLFSETMTLEDATEPEQGLHVQIGM